ncbi:MAG: hypothetical protein ABIK28_01285, partial [Planctomycetota bacterium]
MKRRNTWLLLLILLVFPLCVEPAAGMPQDQSVPQTDPLINTSSTAMDVPTLQAKIAEIESNKEIEEAIKTQVLDLYRQALTRLEAANQYKANAEKFKATLQTAPEDTKRFRQEMEEAKAKGNGNGNATRIELPPEALLKDVEPLLTKEQADLADIKKRLSEYESQIKGEQDRPAKARQETADAKQKLEEIERDLKAPPGNENQQTATARRTCLEARKLARLAEVNMLEQELLSQGVRLELLLIMRESLAYRSGQAEARVAKLQEKTNDLRKKEAEQAKLEAERAEQEALGKHPAISELAKKNADLSRDRSANVTLTEEVSLKGRQLEQQLEQIDRDFKNIKQQVEKVGLSQVMGEVLRNQRINLPDANQFRKNANKRKAQISEANFQLFCIDTQSDAISNLDEAVAKVMAEQVESTLSERQRTRIESEVRKLLETQQEKLRELSSAYNLLVNELGKLDFQETLLREKLDEYTEFLDERLLWIPSAEWFSKETLINLGSSLAWLGNPASWLATEKFLFEGSVLVQFILACFVFALLMLFRRKIRRSLQALADKVGKVYLDSYSLTIKALVYTFLLAIPWPLLMIAVAQFLSGHSSSDFDKAMGAGLQSTAFYFGVTLFLWYFCSPKGLADIHVRWSKTSTSLFRRHLIWLMPVLFPSLFLVSAIESQDVSAYKESLGRFAFLTAMIALGIFTQRMLRPRGGLPSPYLEAHPDGWLAKLKFLWCPGSVMLPLVLAGLSAMGYHYSALQLKDRLFATIAFIIGLMLLHDLILRWLLVTQRRLALAKARERREAAKAAQEAQAGDEGTCEGSPVTLDLPELNIATISAHARHLLRVLAGLSVIVGVWLIWADVLPALGIFEQVALWHYGVEDADG